jgi:hypothetical protein
LTNGKKVTSAEPAFALKGVEVVTTAASDVLHISPYLPLVMHSSDPFHLPVHFKMPYAGALDFIALQLCLYFMTMGCDAHMVLFDLLMYRSLYITCTCDSCPSGYCCIHQTCRLAGKNMHMVCVFSTHTLVRL